MYKICTHFIFDTEKHTKNEVNVLNVFKFDFKRKQRNQWYYSHSNHLCFYSHHFFYNLSINLSQSKFTQSAKLTNSTTSLANCRRGAGFVTVRCTLIFSEACWRPVGLRPRREWHHSSNGPSSSSGLNAHPWSPSFSHSAQAGPSIHPGSI